MKTKYDPIKVTIIIICGFIFFGVLGYFYNKSTRTTTWLICEQKQGYKEKLKFRYEYEILNGFYREEYITYNSKKSLEDGEKLFLEQQKKLKLDDTFKYDYEINEFDMTVKTYINVEKRYLFFNDYLSDFNINNKSTVDDIKNILEGKEYNCSVIYK